MVAYPDRGEGNDPEPFFFCFFWRGGGGGGTLSQQRLNIFTVENMRVMICLGQGGLRSLSASSCAIILVRDYYLLTKYVIVLSFLNGYSLEFCHPIFIKTLGAQLHAWMYLHFKFHVNPAHFLKSHTSYFKSIILTLEKN